MTRVQNAIGGLVAVVCFAVTTSMVSLAAVAPRLEQTGAGTQPSNVLQSNGLAQQADQARQGLVQLAQRRVRRGPRRRFRRGRRRGGDWVGPVIGAGIAAIIIGGAIEASRRNYRDRWELCDEEFRSFRWSDGTYQPYGGGPRRLCPYLRG